MCCSAPFLVMSKVAFICTWLRLAQGQGEMEPQKRKRASGVSDVSVSDVLCALKAHLPAEAITEAVASRESGEALFAKAAQSEKDFKALEGCIKKFCKVLESAQKLDPFLARKQVRAAFQQLDREHAGQLAKGDPFAGTDTSLIGRSRLGSRLRLKGEGGCHWREDPQIPHLHGECPSQFFPYRAQQPRSKGRPASSSHWAAAVQAAFGPCMGRWLHKDSPRARGLLWRRSPAHAWLRVKATVMKCCLHPQLSTQPSLAAAAAGAPMSRQGFCPSPIGMPTWGRW